jgi:HK97 family phage portal protein
MHYPAVVRLFPSEHVTVLGKGDEITGYRIGGTIYDPSDVWHERQYTVPGMPLGLSPIAYAAWSIGNYLSAQQFTQDWFTGGGASMPSGHLKNTARTLTDIQADEIKSRFKSSVQSGDVFTSGSDWEFTPVPPSGTGAQFLESMQYGVSDIARFFGLPGDLIDAVSAAGSITYANVVQRNLQALIWYLQPVFERREAALSRALPRPRFVKFNTDSLLRMDPQTLATTISAQIATRVLTPDEGRAMYNRPPLTEADKKLFLEVFPPKGLLPMLAPDGSVPTEGVPVA